MVYNRWTRLHVRCIERQGRLSRALVSTAAVGHVVVVVDAGVRRVSSENYFVKGSGKGLEFTIIRGCTLAPCEGSIPQPMGSEALLENSGGDRADEHEAGRSAETQARDTGLHVTAACRRLSQSSPVCRGAKSI